METAMLDSICSATGYKIPPTYLRSVTVFYNTNKGDRLAPQIDL